MDSNQPTKEQPLWDIMSELSCNLDGVQEEITESSNFKQPKINLKQQLEQVRLQKNIMIIKVSNKIKFQTTKISIPQNLRYSGRFDF